MRENHVDIINDFVDWWVVDKKQGVNHQNKVMNELREKRGEEGGLSYSSFIRWVGEKWKDEDLRGAFETANYYNLFVFQVEDGVRNPEKHIRKINVDAHKDIVAAKDMLETSSLLFPAKHMESMRNITRILDDITKKWEVRMLDFNNMMKRSNEAMTSKINEYFNTDKISKEDVGNVMKLVLFANAMGLSEEEFMHMAPVEFFNFIDDKIKARSGDEKNQLREIKETMDKIKDGMENQKPSRVVNILSKNKRSFNISFKFITKFLDNLKRLWG